MRKALWRLAPVLLLALALVPAAAASPSSADAAAAPAPVTVLRHDTFGRVLATPRRLALYYWQVERESGGRVRCVGECARVWPPLYVSSRAAVPRRIRGIRGTFGVVRRPDNGRLQVTHNGLPLYLYIRDRPGTVFCDNVDGWFVVRA